MIATVTRASLGPRADTDPSPPSRQDMIVALGIPAFIVLCIGAALIHFIYWRLRRKGKADAGHASFKFLKSCLQREKRGSGHPSEKRSDAEAGHLKASPPNIHLDSEPDWVMVVGGGEGVQSSPDQPSLSQQSPIPSPAPSSPASSARSAPREHVPLDEVSPPPSAMVRPRSSLGTNYSYYNWTSAASDTEETAPDHATEAFRSRTSRASDPFSNQSTVLDHDELDCASDSGTMSTLPPSYRTQRPTAAYHYHGHALPPPPPIPLDLNVTSPPPSAYITRRRISGMFGPRPNVRSSLALGGPSTPPTQGSAPDAPNHASASINQDTSAASKPSIPREGQRVPRRKSVDGGISLAGGPPQELPPSYNGGGREKPSCSQKERTVRVAMT
ncbi:hypothetical protein C8Q70DRAFT_208328 [Cubamyces menziesii]|nr:hypothetical protein C8Q70DRAFT_208328 [Cubamyces menziesii]